MSVKGKAISLKTRSKGAIDVTIRSPEEFSKSRQIPEAVEILERFHRIVGEFEEK